MKMRKTGRSYLWMPLLWTCAIYFWSILALWARSPQQCVNSATVKEVCSTLGMQVLLDEQSIPLILLTLIVVLHGILLWWAISKRVPQRYSWGYTIVQALLILLMGTAIGVLDITQLIYLALTLGAIGMLTQARIMLLIVSLYFLLKGVASMASAENWSAFLHGLRTDYVAPLFLFVLGYLVLYIQQTQLYAKLHESHKELEGVNIQLAASARQVAVLTRQNERQRLAREWHDTLAQSLLGLVRQLDVAQSHLANQRVERAHEIVVETAANARIALAEARNAIVDLRTNIPTPETLPAMVSEEIERFTEATGIVCEANADTLTGTPAEYCEHVQRTISEGLSNVARHAHASRVWIEISLKEGALNLQIRDDGVGLSDTANFGASHYGLIGLRERARLANGQLEVQSQPGEGTILCLSLPARAREEPE